jgi:hypothetical protein
MGQAAALVAVTRLLFLGIAYASSWLLSPTLGPLRGGFFDIWVHWDARHFLQVATFGYTDPATDPNAPAFFPLYPLFTRAVDGLGIPMVAAAMLVSALATWAACVFLLLLADEDEGTGAGRRAVLYMLLFPTAVFLVAPYSESMFLAGAIGSFYFARRGRWMQAALPLAVATATRAAGAFVGLGLLFEFLRGRSSPRVPVSRVAAALVIGSLPALAYLVYLINIEGTPLAYFTAQRVGWSREFVGPVDSFLRTWHAATGPDGPTNWLIAWRFEIAGAAVGVAVTVWALLRREWGYAAYMGSTMVVLMTSTWYFSIPRMLLTFFPIFVFLASITGRHPVWHETIILVSAPAAVLGVVVFTQGAWFF